MQIVAGRLQMDFVQMEQLGLLIVATEGAIFSAAYV